MIKGGRIRSRKKRNTRRKKLLFWRGRFFFIFIAIVGVGALIAVFSPTFLTAATTFVDDSQSEFNAGTHSSTSWQTDAVKLQSGQTSGNFTSQVFDSGAGMNTTWNSLSWTTEGTNYQTALSADANTVGLWHLNETSSTITDSSSNNNNSTAVVGTYGATGKFSNAFTLDGIDDTIVVADANSLDLTDDFSIEGWFKPSGNGTPEGNITVVIDSLEYDIADGRTPFIIAVDDDTYAIAYDGTDNDGWLATVDINVSGGITDTVDDTLEYDTSQGLTPTMIQVDTDTFTIAYKGVDNDGFLTTVDITAAGVINNAVTETLEFDTSNGGTPFIFQVSGSIYGIAYSGLMGDGYVITISIDSAGDIGTIIDTLEFDTADGAQETVVAVDANTFAIAYSGANADGWLATVDIDSSGNISNAVTDTLEFDTSNATIPTIVKVDSDTYAIAYADVNLKGTVVTIDIDSTGNIAAAVTDSFQFDTSQGDDTRIIKTGTTSYAVVYRGPDNDGWLQTISIAANGTITKTAIDSLEFDTANGFAPRIALVKGNTYVIAYAGPGLDGFVVTTSIVNRNGIFKGSDNFRLDADLTTAYGDVNQNVVSASIASGWNHLAMTFDKDAASNQQKLYVNGSLATSGTYTSALATNTSPLQLGLFYAGDLDEVAIYNTVLAASTITEHYKRGILNLKFQARSGSTSPPTSSFTGPSGSTSNYYTSSSSALTDIANNRYFQYKAYLTTDDANFTPELKSVTVDYSATDVTGPSLSSIVSSAGETTATITWSTDETSTSQVEYGTTASYGSTTTLDTSLVTSHSVSLSNLTRNTTYHYRVKSRDNANNTSTSGDYTFITSIPAGPVISSITASNISQTTAIITWNTDTESSSKVFYGTSSGNLNLSSEETQLKTSHSLTLANLNPATIYFYKVSSTDAFNTKSESTERSFTTLAEEDVDDITAPEIDEVDIRNVTTSEATVYWISDEAATSEVLYGLSENYGQSASNNAYVTTHSVTLTGLSAGTFYHLAVRSQDMSENSATSRDYTFSTETSESESESGEDEDLTPDEEPEDKGDDKTSQEPEKDEDEDEDMHVISDIFSSSITDSQAIVSWTTNLPSTGQVFYGTVSGSYPLNSQKIEDNLLTHHSITLGGLTPSTRYVYIVQSYDATGVSVTSGENSFITTETAPAAIGAEGTTEEKTAVGETKTLVEILPTVGDKTVPLVILNTITPNPTSNAVTIFTGSATDETGVIESLAISLDNGTTWRPMTSAEGLGTKTAIFTYMTPTLEDGNYQILARGRDNSDNSGFSDKQNFVVDIYDPIIGSSAFLSGTQPLTLSPQGVLYSVAESGQTLVLSIKGGAIEVNLRAKPQLNPETFWETKFSFISSVGLWKGTVVFPSRDVYDLVVVAKDGAGNVSEKNVGIADVQGAGQIQDKENGQVVNGATVKAHRLDPLTKKWNLWPGDAFGQLNPQLTKESGGYQFQFPSGRYYLEVTKNGYQRTLSNILDLSASGQVSGNILLDRRSRFTLPWLVFANVVTVPATSLSDAVKEETEREVFDKIIGKFTPDFEGIVTNSQGDSSLSLSKYRGQKVLLTFWNTWESKSQEQIAFLEKLNTNLSSGEFSILPVALQEHPATIQTYLRRGNYGLSSFVDPLGELANSYPLLSVPQHFFLNENGRVVKVIVGLVDDATLNKYLNDVK